MAFVQSLNDLVLFSNDLNNLNQQTDTVGSGWNQLSSIAFNLIRS